MSGIDRDRLPSLLEAELAEFIRAHPRSRELYERSLHSLVGGVPMPWMMRWAGGFPVFAAEASGARITDVDGHTYVDLCLGDTGAMPGHSPPMVAEAVARQARRGITTMLPTEDSAWVGEELARRFGVHHWMFTLTATDANRAALRICRQMTGRRKVLAYSYCYHGTVDETFAIATPGGTRARAGNVGAPVDVAETTVAIEFNDLDALERALESEEIACVLAEPAMTNMGIILPDPGYHETLRELTARTGTLLIIDETHTFSAGPGGCTAAWGLDPDLVTIGKAIGSGVPAGALGLKADAAERMLSHEAADYEDTGGVGGTLAGNAALAGGGPRHPRARPHRGGLRPHDPPRRRASPPGSRRSPAGTVLPWNVTQLGCRAEYRFESEPARNGTQAHAAADPELERYLHLHALNRGVLLTPFHNMALISPQTSEADVDRHTEVFDEAVASLAG